MRSLQQFWSVRRIGEDRVTLARLGPLRLWLARAEKEWALAWHYGEGRDLMDLAQVPEDVVPDGLEWRKFMFREAPRDYLFEGEIGHRPFLTDLGIEVGLLPGEEVQVFVPIPVFVRVRAITASQSSSLGKVASEEIYRSRMGDPVGGNLCYAASATPVFDPANLESHPNQIICPVTIHNRHSDTLVFRKLCLRARRAGLFSGSSHCWASPSSISYEGPAKGCVVRLLDKAPEFEEHLQTLTASRQLESHYNADDVFSC